MLIDDVGAVVGAASGSLAPPAFRVHRQRLRRRILIEDGDELVEGDHDDSLNVSSPLKKLTKPTSSTPAAGSPGVVTRAAAAAAERAASSMRADFARLLKRFGVQDADMYVYFPTGFDLCVNG